MAEQPLVDPLADLIDPTNDLMPRDDRQERRRGTPLDLIQLGVTDAAGLDPDPHLPCNRLRGRKIDQAQWLLVGGQIG